MTKLSPFRDHRPLNIPITDYRIPGVGGLPLQGAITAIRSLFPPFDCQATIQGEGSNAQVHLDELLRCEGIGKALKELENDRFAVYDALCSLNRLSAPDQSPASEPVVLRQGDVFVLDNQTGRMQDNVSLARFVAGDMVVDWAGATSPGGYLYPIRNKPTVNNDLLFGAVTAQGILLGLGDGVGPSRPDVKRFIHCFKEEKGDLIAACRSAASQLTRGICITAQLIQGFNKPTITIRAGDVLARQRDEDGWLIASSDDLNNTTVYDVETGRFYSDMPPVPQSVLEYFVTERGRLKKYYQSVLSNRLENDESENAQSQAWGALSNLIANKTRVRHGMRGGSAVGQKFNAAFEGLLNRLVAGDADPIQRDPYLLYVLGPRVLQGVRKDSFEGNSIPFDCRPGAVAEPGHFFEGACDGVYENLRQHSDSGALLDDEWGLITRDCITQKQGPWTIMHRLAQLVDVRTQLSCSPDYFPALWAFLNGFKLRGDNVSAYVARLVQV